jgi:3-oxoacyl-[acyl-carrier-protein] synthase-3
MSRSEISGCRIAGIATAVPSRIFDNTRDTTGFGEEEVRKVVAMAGVKQRHVSDGSICSSDLCLRAAENLLRDLGWDKDSVDGLIMVTQTPDYFLPSTSSLIHRDLGLGVHCASFDVGLGCSGYPYGLWMAAMMVNSGLQRVLVLHGETPSVFTSPEDRATHLLFGDAGSATAVERKAGAAPWYFNLQSDGSGYDALLIPAGGFRQRFSEDQRQYYLHMNGTDLFNFTIKRVPPLIHDTLEMAGIAVDDVDRFVFHQSNQFMMKHLAKKCGLPAEKTPVILAEYGNTGGASVPLTITRGVCSTPLTSQSKLMLLGYGVGLSWGSALIDLDENTAISHCELAGPCLGR